MKQKLLILLLLSLAATSCEQIQTYMEEQAKKETQALLDAEEAVKKEEAAKIARENDPILIEQKLQEKLDGMNMEDPMSRVAAKKLVLQHNRDKQKRNKKIVEAENSDADKKEEYSNSVDNWMIRIK